MGRRSEGTLFGLGWKGKENVFIELLLYVSGSVLSCFTHVTLFNPHAKPERTLEVRN